MTKKNRHQIFLSRNPRKDRPKDTFSSDCVPVRLWDPRWDILAQSGTIFVYLRNRSDFRRAVGILDRLRLKRKVRVYFCNADWFQFQYAARRFRNRYRIRR